MFFAAEHVSSDTERDVAVVSHPRLVLLALDAADPTLVRRWSADGYLPTFAALLKSGTVVPVATPPAVLESAVWPTCLTGASAAAHGMFASHKLQVGTYFLADAMRADRLPFPPFWAWLSRAGRRVTAIDVPFARPLPEVRGVQITNWGAHDGWAWDRASWPPRLIDDVVHRFGDHPVGRCEGRDRTLGEYADLHARLLAGVRQKTALLQHCVGMAEWDFLFGVYSEAHCAGHQLWHFMDESHPRHVPRAALHTAIRDVYQALDAGVASVLQRLPSDLPVLVLLSHGMGPWYDGSHLLPTILDTLGLGGTSTLAPTASATDPSRARTLLWRLRSMLPVSIRNRVKSQFPRAVQRIWQSTHRRALYPCGNPAAQAFAIPCHRMTGGIRINVQGREPAGRVRPGREYDALCAELTTALEDLRNADTGEPAVCWVQRADVLFRGRCIPEMPDLFVEWDHRVPIWAVCSDRLGVVSGAPQGDRTGEHRDGGLLIAAGPPFRSGELTDSMDMQDLAPTVLDFLNVPTPAYMEGDSCLSRILGVTNRSLAITTT